MAKTFTKLVSLVAYDATLTERTDDFYLRAKTMPDTVSLRDAELSRAAVAIGSEGRGLSAEILSKCEKTIKIPMSPRCESLNAAVAASVVLWEMYR